MRFPRGGDDAVALAVEATGLVRSARVLGHDVVVDETLVASGRVPTTDEISGLLRATASS